MISDRCKGVNLLNHLKQKNIPFELKQYQYISKDIYNGYENFYRVNHNDIVFLLDLITNKEEILKEKHPYWVTDLTFNGNKYNAEGNSKRNSLNLVLEKAELNIRNFLNQI
tara:strand:- start:1153 stop:1485 length:333 start_codon:yes stop_codon:yes gene_type:complete